MTGCLFMVIDRLAYCLVVYPLGLNGRVSHRCEKVAGGAHCLLDKRPVVATFQKEGEQVDLLEWCVKDNLMDGYAVWDVGQWGEGEDWVWLGEVEVRR